MNYPHPTSEDGTDAECGMIDSKRPLEGNETR